VLLYGDFTIFASWIYRKYKNIRGENYFKELEKNYRTLPLFYTDENTDGMSNTNEITNRFNPLKSSIELKIITGLCHYFIMIKL
jgi:hypothetical protein